MRSRTDNLQPNPRPRLTGERNAEPVVIDDLPSVPLITSRELDIVNCYMDDVLAKFLQRPGLISLETNEADLRPPLSLSDDAA
jgi:hypothetical protein